MLFLTIYTDCMFFICQRIFKNDDDDDDDNNNNNSNNNNNNKYWVDVLREIVSSYGERDPLVDNPSRDGVSMKILV